MRQSKSDDIRERSVAVVVVQPVRIVEVVSDIKIRPTVTVVVPPTRGQSVSRLTAYTGEVGNVCERAVAVVAE
jgi:hypothetical protein